MNILRPLYLEMVNPNNIYKTHLYTLHIFRQGRCIFRELFTIDKNNHNDDF